MKLQNTGAIEMKRLMFSFVAILTLLGFTPAFAQATWLPNYERGTYVQVDPALQDQVQVSEQFSNAVAQRAQVNQMHFTKNAESAETSSQTAERAPSQSADQIDVENRLRRVLILLAVMAVGSVLVGFYMLSAAIPLV
jgi:hypothetical protein